MIKIKMKYMSISILRCSFILFVSDNQSWPRDLDLENVWLELLPGAVPGLPGGPAHRAQDKLLKNEWFGQKVQVPRLVTLSVYLLDTLILGGFLFLTYMFVIKKSNLKLHIRPFK